MMENIRDSPEYLLTSQEDPRDSPEYLLTSQENPRDSPEYLLTSQEDPRDSPEYLLTSQEDQRDSPKCLTSEPFRDPYSTDDESEKKHKLQQVTRKNHSYKLNTKDDISQDFKLHEVECSSQITPAHVLYFLDVDFNPVAKHEEIIDTENDSNFESIDSVEDCLFELFRFITCISTPNNKKMEFRYNNRTMSEIKQLYFEMDMIKWMSKNDCCDWKNTTVEMRKQKKVFFLEKYVQAFKTPNAHAIGNVCGLILQSLEFYEELVTASDAKDNGFKRRRDCLKKFFEIMGIIMGTRNYIQNDECQMEFKLHVPTIDVPDGSYLIENRTSIILSEPDAVYKSAWPEKYKISVEIYQTKDDANVISPAQPLLSQVQSDSSNLHNKYTDGKIKDQSSNTKNTNKPVKACGIFDTHYELKAKEYSRKSLPYSCCYNSHYVDNMTGKHVIQLFCQAYKNSRNILSASDLVAVGNMKLQRELGMFIVNEHVYFSRLDIDPGLLPYISGERYKEMTQFDIPIFEKQVKECFQKPQVSYSHFRLDITKASHRIALIIFVKEVIENLTLSGLVKFDDKEESL